METYQLTAEEVKLVEQVLEENHRRQRELAGDHDQTTGRGMPRHTNRMRIAGYPIYEQWLTDEVYNHPLYKEVRTHGLDKFVSIFNRENNELEFPLTKDQLIEELLNIRCANDPGFAFIICFTIIDKMSGESIPFKLNHAQMILLEKLEGMRLAGEPIRLVLLKARQWGGSTLVQLYMDWLQIFVKTGWNSIILAQTKDTSRRIKAMYHGVVKNLPNFIFHRGELTFSPFEGSQSDFILTDRARKMVRDNVTTVASYENYESARGQNYALAHYSEVAFWRKTPSKSAEALITNISGGILPLPLTLEVLESTANGATGFFHDEYQLAKKGKSSRQALFIPFFHINHDQIPFPNAMYRRRFAEKLVKYRNDTEETETTESGKYLWWLWQMGASLEHINWYVQKRAGFHDHASMAQEAPADDVECFKFSGNMVFSPYLVSLLREQHVRKAAWRGGIMEVNGKPFLHEDPNGKLLIWKHPNQLETHDEYLVVVDVGGRSKQSDPSCITVINRWARIFEGGKDEVVARWHGHLRYDQLAWLAVYIARYYKDAKLAFESNTMDKKKAEAGEFIEQGDHIRGILETISRDYKNLYMRKATDPEDIKKGILQKIGFHTNTKTKQDMIDNFIVMFEDNRFIDPDDRLYAEAAIYEQRPDGSYGNREGRDNHDDILMTDMIGELISASMPVPGIVVHEEEYEEVEETINESSM